MTPSALHTYIAGIDQRWAPLVLALDRAIRGARPDLDSKVYYRMLSYAHSGDFRHWICAIDARDKVVCLRFLFGSLLDAPPGLFRAGTTTMRTIDYTSLDQVDAQLVANLVTQAVARLADYKAEHPPARRAK
jgi:hypothetical protein